MKRRLRALLDWLIIAALAVAMMMTSHPDPRCKDPDGNGEVPKHCVD